MRALTFCSVFTCLIATALVHAQSLGAQALEEQSLDKKQSAVIAALEQKARVEFGQAVTISVERVNVDQDWAVVVGEIESEKDAKPWYQGHYCDHGLDKALWAVMQKNGDSWRYDQLYWCATEPVYWYLEDEIGLIWPCGVYQGLQATAGETLEQTCRRTAEKTTVQAPVSAQE
ncbi:hypothetical protein VST7929_01697 [Vibrio stylophorae]|uniref:Secreted protein n=1 Tax=Vibrio stylophorae TaxID=659351 RepID=A0ABN8DSY9_9VIBR|nr:hypothetical protein [Vibrio stylophorae]CAH0533822.1 hypothetical protein VST7929_01697 [Vibrio stylophorae]